MINFQEIFKARDTAITGDQLRQMLQKYRTRDRLRPIRKARRNTDDAYDDAYDVSSLSDDDIDTINEQLSDDDDDGGGSSAGGNHIEHLATLICQATGASREEALRWLMNTNSGQALVARTKRRKEANNMPETFAKIVADIGIERVADAVVKRGEPSRIGEKEYIDAVTDFAAKKYPTLKRDVAFSRLFCGKNEQAKTLRDAWLIIKNVPMMKVEPLLPSSSSVGGTSGDDQTVDDPEDALAQLQALVDRMRAASAEMAKLSREKCFEKVYTDPANARLAAAERRQNRPTARALYGS